MLPNACKELMKYINIIIKLQYNVFDYGLIKELKCVGGAK